MTFHPRSLVEFGEFLTRISENLSHGAKLRQTVELIRVHLGGSAAAIRVEDRAAPGRGFIILSEGPGDSDRLQDVCLDSRAAGRLAELLESRRYMAAATSSDLDGGKCTLWVFRDSFQPAFDAEEASLCEIIAGQIRRGLELSQRISAGEIERALYSKVMDRLAVGILILDFAGRVIKFSAKAEEALAARDGLQIQSGRLRATCGNEDRKLQQAIKAATHSAINGEMLASCGLALTRASGNRNLGLIVQPVYGVQRTGMALAPTVAIYIRDSEAKSDVESDLVRQLLDLSPAEAAVARRLAAGLSLEDTANSLDISRNTARAHLRSIFSKSGVTRQTELVRLVLNSAAMLGERPLKVA